MSCLSGGGEPAVYAGGGAVTGTGERTTGRCSEAAVAAGCCADGDATAPSL